MQLWVYDKILRHKGEDPLKRCQQHTYTAVENALRCDLADGKCIWTNSFCQDYRYFIQCNHLLISIFCISSLHPFTRKERMIALFNEICLSFSICIFFESQDFYSTLDTKHGHKISMAIEAVIVSSISFTMQKYAICRFVQNANDQTRKRWEHLGEFAFCVITLLCIACTVCSLIVFFETNENDIEQESKELHHWLSAQALSLIIDLFVNLGQFLNARHWEKKAIRRGKSTLYLTFVDYLNWKKSLLLDFADTRSDVATAVKLFELEQRESIDMRQSHYIVDAENNVTERRDLRHLSEKYPQLKGKKMIVFVR